MKPPRREDGWRSRNRNSDGNDGGNSNRGGSGSARVSSTVNAGSGNIIQSSAVGGSAEGISQDARQTGPRAAEDPALAKVRAGLQQFREILEQFASSDERALGKRAADRIERGLADPAKLRDTIESGADTIAAMGRSEGPVGGKATEVYRAVTALLGP
ncbi:hypothetical protein OK074_3770 [Actinobacteria bacterium OK074]|nr:hypothetical protein OK074_3770 [Actinobacteria bacterium OK074]